MHHGRLEVFAFRVLALSLVRVLVSPKGLGGWEVSAAVMAFESPAALASVLVVVIIFVAAVVDDGVCVGVGTVPFCVFGRIGVIRGLRVVSSGVGAKFYAEEPNALFFVEWRGGADEG